MRAAQFIAIYIENERYWVTSKSTRIGCQYLNWAAELKAKSFQTCANISHCLCLKKIVRKLFQNHSKVGATVIGRNLRKSELENVKGINLNILTVDDLLTLRDRINETLANRVDDERRELESRLARLYSMDVSTPGRLARGGQVIGRRASVAPKYRNPENPFETWSGRGRQPRWLTAAIKGGKKIRDFKISADKQK